MTPFAIESFETFQHLETNVIGAGQRFEIFHFKKRLASHHRTHIPDVDIDCQYQHPHQERQCWRRVGRGGLVAIANDGPPVSSASRRILAWRVRPRAVFDVAAVVRRVEERRVRLLPCGRSILRELLLRDSSRRGLPFRPPPVPARVLPVRTWAWPAVLDKWPRRPSEREGRPSEREGRPSEREGRPSARERRPSARERRPSVRERRPSACVSATRASTWRSLSVRLLLLALGRRPSEVKTGTLGSPPFSNAADVIRSRLRRPRTRPLLRLLWLSADCWLRRRVPLEPAW
ncbi:conserved hypothetical protein [Trichinella spiralis]|uniref:hypothetical protein n=1 Tax=Trichinella spiralis TaxID=6334 RepID=UPI0001EFE2DF|nr:conserved hypothetical protein [Trichinella spiralis]